MNLFEAVKDAVPMREAAEYYGIHSRRNGMACCPFHDDKTPSLKLYERRFHCFGCQEDGDVIDFVGKLYGLESKQAAEKIAEDFRVQYDRLDVWDSQKRPSVISKLTAAQEYRKKENRCYYVLCQYFHLLRDWKERYAPQREDEDWHPLFVEALQRADYIEYLLDSLICASLEERSAIVSEMETKLDALEKRIADYSGHEDIPQETVQHRESSHTKIRGMRRPEELAM